ncbi:MAG: PTS sugar transporter subunit IIB [Longicatena sp.]
MRQIRLFCNAGLSTSLLVNKMRKAAEEENYEVEINAFPIDDVEMHADDADIIILGPQIRFKLKETQSKFPEKKVITLDMAMYGRMDGKGVIKEVRKILGD